MSDFESISDKELIIQLLVSESWKALDRRLAKMEQDAFDSLLRAPETGVAVAAEVSAIRKIRRLPSDMKAARV